MVTNMAPHLSQYPHERVVALVSMFQGACAPGHCMGLKAPDHPINVLCSAQDGGAEDSKA
jgi:hypothetical protein